MPRLFTIVIAMFCATALVGCGGAGPDSSAELLGVELETLDGAAISLAAADEGVVVVNFWASYCKPCIREMPALQRVAEAHPEVRFIGVNALDEPELATELVAQTGVTYEIWLDAQGDAMRAAGVRSLPGTLVLDDGAIVYTKLGEISESELTQALRDAGA